MKTTSRILSSIVIVVGLSGLALMMNGCGAAADGSGGDGEGVVESASTGGGSGEGEGTPQCAVGKIGHFSDLGQCGIDLNNMGCGGAFNSSNQLTTKNLNMLYSFVDFHGTQHYWFEVVCPQWEPTLPVSCTVPPFSDEVPGNSNFCGNFQGYGAPHPFLVDPHGCSSCE